MLVKYYHIYDQAEVEREHRNQKPNQRHAVIHYDVKGVKKKSGKIINPSLLDTFHDLIYHRQISSQMIDDQKVHEQILLKRFILPELNAKYLMKLDAKEFLRDKSQKIMEYIPELQRARIPDALARTEGGQGQDIKTKVREGTIKIL